MGVYRSSAWERATAYLLILAGLLLWAAGAWTAEASSPWTAVPEGPAGAREAFVSGPIGPFALLANPALVALTDELGLHLGLEPVDGEKPVKFLAYSDPGTGLAAGALVWLDGAGQDGSPWRQIAYSLGRFLTDRIALGASIKHIAGEAGDRWATDLGVYIPARENVRLGLVYYNALGADDDDPEEIAAAVSLLSRWGWAVAVEVRTPWSSHGPDPALSWALDIPLGPGGVVRAAHLRLLGGSTPGEWLTGLRWDFGSYGLDAAVSWQAGGDVRYRVGFRFTF